MAIPPRHRQLAETELERFCRAKVPPILRDKVRLEVAWRGDAVTLYECGAPWRRGDDWSRRPAARLRFDEPSATWSVDWQRANGRWSRYEPATPSSRIRDLIVWLRRDQHGVFWG